MRYLYKGVDRFGPFGSGENLLDEKPKTKLNKFEIKLSKLLILN